MLYAGKDDLFDGVDGRSHCDNHRLCLRMTDILGQLVAASGLCFKTVHDVLHLFRRTLMVRRLSLATLKVTVGIGSGSA
ncbi:Uncharacterised protein [Vibrio cholerae]|nr:Uncharacterised protein [Vibrio cholerae]